MTVEVVIRHDASGILRANVLQHGQLGSNLLARRSLTSVESAQMVARAELFKKLGYSIELEIVWTVRA